MQITFEQYERIQRYLDGNMAPLEEKLFLAELNQDISLKESLDFENELKFNLSSIGEKKDLLEKYNDYYKTPISVEDGNSVLSLIEKAGNEWQEENNSRRDIGSHAFTNKREPQAAKVVKMKLWIAVAVSACIILAVTIFVIIMRPKPMPPNIAAIKDTSAAKKNTDTEIAKTSSGDSIKKISSAIKKFDGRVFFKKYYAKDLSNPQMPDLLAMVPAEYQKGDYSFREIDLGKVANTRGASNDLNSKQNILQFAHYYKGLSYIETKDYKTAIENLRWVIDSARSPQLKIKAQWYLALIYINEDNLQKAMPLLLSLSKNPNQSPYHNQAAELLESFKQQHKHK
jgi:tetratricopeptide (TPR) repeat protein